MKLFKKLFKKRHRCKLLGKHIEIGESRVDKNSVVGDYTYIGRNCTVTKAEIGRYVSIANNVTIGPGEHDVNDVTTSAWFYDDAVAVLCAKECVIGNDVWIGVDSIIRRGVKIGNGAVVGANSFVNKDVPDFAIVAGNPARIIRYRFDEYKRAKISASKWWEKDLPEAKEIIQQLRKLF